MAAQTYKSRFDHSRYVGLKIRKATQLAELQFVEAHSGAFAVTIPLGSLKRLYDDVQRKLQKDASLFVR